MLPIDFSYYICYYLGGALFVFFFFLLLPGEKASSRGRSLEERLRQCGVCTHVYFDASSSRQAMSVCPLCGSYNQKSRI